MDTDANGKLYILGLASDVKLTVTEYKAPDGYNKLTETKELTPQVLEKSLYEASGTRRYDEDGNLLSETATSGSTKTVERNLDELDAAALKIENNAGTVLPSTGGMGTTILYVVGGVMVAGAAVYLLTKKRASSMQ
jgi:LPXTG-motif cell wall-anchored protein